MTCALTPTKESVVSITFATAAARRATSASSAASAAPPLPPAKSVLKMGEMIAGNSTMQSPGRTHYAIQQDDGNLCVYKGTPEKPAGHQWCHNGVGAKGQYTAVLQGDGNLCTYRGTPAALLPGPLWCSKTSGQVFLALQDDGNLCVYRGTGPGDNRGGLWCHNKDVLPAGAADRRT